MNNILYVNKEIKYLFKNSIHRFHKQDECLFDIINEIIMLLQDTKIRSLNYPDNVSLLFTEREKNIKFIIDYFILQLRPIKELYEHIKEEKILNCK